MRKLWSAFIPFIFLSKKHKHKKGISSKAVCTSVWYAPSSSRPWLEEHLWLEIHEEEEETRSFSFLFSCKTRRYCIRKRNLMSLMTVFKHEKPCLNINWWELVSKTQLWWYFCVLEKATSIEKFYSVFDWKWAGTKHYTGTEFPTPHGAHKRAKLFTFKTATFWTVTHFAFMFIYTVYSYNSTKIFSSTPWQLNHQCRLHYFHESKINHLATDVSTW